MQRQPFFLEIQAFLQELDVESVGDYTIDTLTLYKFESTDEWREKWWESMSWTAVRTFHLNGRCANQ